MKTRRIIFSSIVAILYIFLSFTLYCAEEGFLYQLELSLKAYGWADEEIIPVMNAAQHMNWENIDNDNCDIVAYSLQYCKRSGQETKPGEKAQIAYNLAITSSEMKALGFDDKIVARVAVDSTREIVKSLNRYRKNEKEIGMGDMIRDRIRDQVCKEESTEQQNKLMERVQNRIRKEKKDRVNPHNEIGNGPVH